MPKFLFIIAQEGFRDEELKIPFSILDKAGIECYKASPIKDLAFGKLGLQISPDFSIKEIDYKDFDGICIVGGPGATELKKYPETLELIKNFFNAGKLTTAICIGPSILGAAGILKDKKITLFPDRIAIDELKKVGAQILIEKDLVEDDNIITANGPKAAEKFGNAIKERLICP
ncbi:MAG: ThiJ/PfpI domain protein [Candidatus Peregrinibacteria bacterium GW2011_GWA2_33_10]|nr:MAG: ThiJ/PfpI domain protein [Candidatus Peregrinibacteria bacterium GW2011_GWA2_33_10]KKP38482.1 MAG: PfpI family intracellular peptidase, protease I [Candidatus Peregrinibacteria bacterium GW2011_GWC2_33_13]OGJ50022.1 MAG: hypothetical protein A2229_04245 [Candidatus Peregrinibacteria bacterium RIFOXYA2_FULL_33_7]